MNVSVASCLLINEIFTVTPLGMYYYPYFTDRETEAMLCQREVMLLIQAIGADPRFKPGDIGS